MNGKNYFELDYDWDKPRRFLLRKFNNLRTSLNEELDCFGQYLVDLEAAEG